MWSRSVLESVLVFVIFGSLSEILFSGVEGTVDCYVCSWSDTDIVIRNKTRANDTCTSKKFQGEVSKTVTCDGGCETVAYYLDPKHTTLKHFHRNCVDQTSGRYLTDQCRNITGTVYFEEKCECLSNLCNSSPSTTFSWFRSCLILPVTIIISSRVSSTLAFFQHP